MHKGDEREAFQMKFLKINFLLVDIGFLFYWTITYFKLIPDELLFPDYKNPTLVTWNWSFFPIDLVLSITGMSSLILLNRKNETWFFLALISLSLTHASGLMAISFWAIQGWFDLSWWLPNLYLMLYPIPMLIFLIRNQAKSS
jgi:hypothetical protein